ncbi:MAG: flavohemoglobin expression-modulating QEGLA motif protein [Gammaproteobacteria bacterium]|nr:flavohemoglobin expression-modulating QEGLA motif protein [Gammaproteobacteria bacterium]
MPRKDAPKIKSTQKKTKTIKKTKANHTPETYKATLRELSDTLVQIQKPIRLLDSMKWDKSIQDDFFKHKFKKLPPVSATYYENIPLEFDIQSKISEFFDLERDIRRRLGQYNAVGEILQRMCREYREVVRMIRNRGKSEFTKISQELFGSSEDALYAGQPSLNDLATMITEALVNLKSLPAHHTDERVYTSAEAVAILQARLNKYFHGARYLPQVRLTDGIIADAAAGADSIKIKKGAFFSERELRLLEVHEGWVHVGTTLNGAEQPVCTFLSKGPPSSTVTQEGLATIIEIFTFASYPDRVRRLTNRIKAIQMAEAGADFIQVFNFFREQGLDEQVSYNYTVRVFRGSLPNAGPFTKDLVYSKGFILIYNYIRLSILQGDPGRVSLLFSGKTTLEDLRVLSELQEEGILVPPKFIPPQFLDLGALSAWMCYSLFLNKLNLKMVARDYQNLL